MPKIALDIHGVIDAEPRFFSWLSNHLKDKGWEVHILTGGRLIHNEQMLKDAGIHYDQFFSITDYHLKLGTPAIKGVCDGGICVEDKLWNPVKGKYCEVIEIDILVDDTLMYKKYMPYFTHFEHWSIND